MVLGVIALLLAVVIVSMRPIRNTANRTESAASLRQMVVGYSAYSADHRQTLMPGYLNSTWVEELKINSTLPGGRRFVDYSSGTPDAAALGALNSYVWRLAPYLDHDWRTVMADYRSESFLSILRAKETQGMDALAEIAAVPSFGLNSLFLGGDMRHGGPTLAPKRPWELQSGKVAVNSERIAALRFTEVRNPSRVIVFAPAARFAGGPCESLPYHFDQNLQMGYPELRPPFILWEDDAVPQRWSLPQWHIGRADRVHAPDQIANFYTEGGGVPVVRWGNHQYPVAHLDGSTAVEDIREISVDMRRWAPQAVGLETPLTTSHITPPTCP
jgi:hypothetical protein